MSDSNHHINFTSVDIENYLQGKMSNAERNALEKAALTDPFLADAIEGFEMASLSKAKNMLHETETFIKSSANKSTLQQKHYAFTDMENYLQGKMSNAERNALEKAALTDSFLADAIEGFTITDLNKANKFIEETTVKIKEGSSEKAKVVVMPMYKQQWFRVAAAIILMVGVGSTVWLLNNNATTENNNPIANVVKEEITQTPNDNLIVNPNTQTPNGNLSNKTAKSSNKKSKMNSADLAGIKGIETSKEANAAFITSEASAGVFSTEDAKANTETNVVKNTVGDPPAHPTTVAEAKDKNQLSNHKQEEALVKSTMVAENSANQNAKKINTRGAVSSNVTVSANMLNNEGITPVGGWQKFEEYINKQIASLPKKYDRVDSVTVTFYINKEGKPYQIQAQSPSPEKSAKVVEFIEEGVNWQVKNATNNKAVIVIKL